MSYPNYTTVYNGQNVPFSIAFQCNSADTYYIDTTLNSQQCTGNESLSDFASLGSGDYHTLTCPHDQGINAVGLTLDNNFYPVDAISAPVSQNPIYCSVMTIDKIKADGTIQVHGSGTCYKGDYTSTPEINISSAAGDNPCAGLKASPS